MEKIAVVGIGRLGLCLALNLEACGYEVIGVDINEDYVLSLNAKTFSSSEPLVNEFLKKSKAFKATTQIEELFSQQIDVIFIVVPTPSLASGEFSHEYIDAILVQLQNIGRQEKEVHIVINSTCMPGYCDSIESKLNQLNFTLTYNPEFIAQGSIIKDQQYPDQILIGGENIHAADIITSIYKQLCKNKPQFFRMGLKSAEITKLATNCFLTTKIAFANAIGDIASIAGAQPDIILNAIGADSRIGNRYFRYGFGYGGPCFPRDNKAFLQFAKRTEYPMLISQATDDANKSHSDYLVKEWMRKTDDEIVFESITYKPGTDIIEQSQQLELAVELAKAGKKVIIKESAAVIKMLIDNYSNLFTYQINDN